MKKNAERFIYSRCDLMEIDKDLFSKSMIKRAVSATEGSPLYIEDLMRLTATASSAEEAIQLWADREGNDARRYALQRECELLNSNARRVLLAASIVRGPVSFAEIEAITGISTTAMNSALQELQGVFLIPKPRLVEGEQRFEINLNTRALVREAYENDDLYRRTETAYRTFSGEIPRARSGDVAAVIRQAHFLVKTTKHYEAERLLLTALEKYQSNPDLTGFLGWVYKAWPKPRVTDARAQFVRAYQLKCKKHDMYVHWCRMELDAGEWTKAAEAAEKASRLLPDNRTLLFFAGYARTWLGRELLSGLHFEKARREFSEARTLLEKSLTATGNAETQEPTSTSRIYRTLVLVCEHSEDIDGLRHYFKLWWSEHPDDPICKSEWDRVSRRYSLPVLDQNQSKAVGLSETRPRKIRCYDLAKELKLDNKKVMADARREGVDVSVPSNTVPIEVADRIRAKYFPPKKARPAL
jgi:tetratricopeptide (TPR) repeat protein